MTDVSALPESDNLFYWRSGYRTVEAGMADWWNTGRRYEEVAKLLLAFKPTVYHHGPAGNHGYFNGVHVGVEGRTIQDFAQRVVAVTDALGQPPDSSESYVGEHGDITLTASWKVARTSSTGVDYKVPVRVNLYTGECRLHPESPKPLTGYVHPLIHPECQGLLDSLTDLVPQGSKP